MAEKFSFLIDALPVSGGEPVTGTSPKKVNGVMGKLSYSLSFEADKAEVKAEVKEQPKSKFKKKSKSSNW